MIKTGLKMAAGPAAMLSGFTLRDRPLLSLGLMLVGAIGLALLARDGKWDPPDQHDGRTGQP